MISRRNKLNKDLAQEYSCSIIKIEAAPQRRVVKQACSTGSTTKVRRCWEV
jgi:hypothetical protein